MIARAGAIILPLSLALSGCAHFGKGGGTLPPGTGLTPQEREDVIRRAEVWSPTDIPSLNLKVGLPTKAAFASNEWVNCDYKEKRLGGRSAKFACVTPEGKEIRVKYGLGNAELYGSVLSTRLFWALGFGAMRIDPVRVRCHGCPQDPWRNAEKTSDVRAFDPATVMEWTRGRAMETRS